MVSRVNLNIIENHEAQGLLFNVRSRSLLETLWNKEKITDLHFIAGMSYGILRARAHRSLGIPNRLRAMGHFLEKLNGKSVDQYEDFLIEKAWAYVMKSLDPLYNHGINFVSVLDVLVADKTYFSGEESKIIDVAKDALDTLATIWLSLEKSKLRTNIPKKISTVFA